MEIFAPAFRRVMETRNLLFNSIRGALLTGNAETKGTESHWKATVVLPGATSCEITAKNEANPSASASYNCKIPNSSPLYLEHLLAAIRASLGPGWRSESDVKTVTVFYGDRPGKKIPALFVEYILDKSEVSITVLSPPLMTL
jgi:hypothetical protein